MMQSLIGITKDEAVVNVQRPLDSAVDAFVEGANARGPTLKPMQFAFNRPYTHGWNQELVRKFVNYFTAQHNVPETDRDLVYEICKQRFETLQVIFRRNQPRNDEDEAAVKNRLWERKQRVESMSRKTTRRQTVST